MCVDDQSVSLLKEFAMDPEPIVSQSCEVALTMLEYEGSGKSFEVCISKYNSKTMKLWIECVIRKMTEVYVLCAVPLHASSSSTIDNNSALLADAPNW